MEKWIRFSEKLKAAKKYYRPRIEPECLWQMRQLGRAVVRFDKQGELIAFTASYESGNWEEIGTVFVDPAHEGNGLARELISEALSIEGKRQHFLITSDLRVVHLATDFGFEPWFVRREHDSVAARTVFHGWADEVKLPTKRIPGSVFSNPGIPPDYQEGTRYLFIQPPR